MQKKIRIKKGQKRKNNEEKQTANSATKGNAEN